MSNDAPRTVEAVQRTCAIIDALERTGETGITELAEEVEFSKSTVHGHLSTLVEEGFVVKDGHEYRLSLRFLGISDTLLNKVTDYENVREEVVKLANDVGEVVHFGRKEDGQVVYIAKASGEGAVHTESSMGDRVPMHSTSLGKAILADLPREQVAEIVQQYGLERQTKHTITDIDELYRELDEIEEQGYAVDNEENILGVRCIGTSVTGPESRVRSALSITGPTQRMTDQRIEDELQRKLVETANVIEVNAKYS